MVVISILLIFGGEVIRPFALAIFIGIIVGTYSSIYVASPVLIYWHERFGAGAELTRKVTA
jgi:preprotein translocase subunit SecF